MDSNVFNNIIEKVKTLLGGMPWKKILTFSFFVLLSAIFWFFQIYRENFNATYTIPLKYINIPDSIIFDTNLPSDIQVTVRDNGLSMFVYHFSNKKDTLEIDVTTALGTLPTNVLQGTSYQQLIKSKLLVSSNIVVYEPNYISFNYTALQHKKIPVIFDGQIFLSAGYLLDGEIKPVPDSIIVYGSSNALKGMNYAYTTDDTIKNFASKEPLFYSLKKMENIKFVPERVQINVPIDKYTEKEIYIPIVCYNLPEDLDIRFFPSSIRASFWVGLSNYSEIDDEDFKIEFDYNELMGLQQTVVPVRLTSYPDYIQNLAITPTEVEFIFEKK